MGSLLNLTIILLLVIAIIYAMILNHRLNSFQEGKKEISNTIQRFNAVVQNAETTLLQLHKSSENISSKLQAEIKKASLLRDDLVLILDKTNNRQYPPKKDLPQPTFSYAAEKKSGIFTRPHSEEKPFNIYQSDAEKELFQALQRLKGES